MPAVPAFSLYGERSASGLGDWLHCESIPVRSGLHDWEIRPHRHPHFFQILYLSRGSGECLLEGRTARLVSPTVVTVTPGAVHGFRFEPDVEGWVLTCMADRATTMMGSPELQAAFERPHHVPLGDAAAAIGGCLDLVAGELGAPRRGRDELLEAQLRSVLLLLARCLPGAGSREGPASPIGRRAEQFRLLLDRRFRAEHAVGFYASALGVSETHLNRICRAAMGRSALSAIHERVAAEARLDLAFTTMGVAEIARSLGFEDAAYFSRFFSKRMGEGPRAYRRRTAGDIALSRSAGPAAAPDASG